VIAPIVDVVPRRLARAGFTLVELLVAIAIVGLVMTVSVPASVRFYESMQYRQAIRDVTTTLSSARYRAFNTGKSQDVLLNTETNVLRLGSETQQLPVKLDIVMHSARDVNRDTEGVIRFYPEGGSSGGEIDIVKPNRSGVKITVDWLVGRVSQQKYDFN
jgi:general secretion pathway protein H